MKLAICDDDPAQREYLNDLVQQWAEARQLPVVRVLFASADA